MTAINRLGDASHISVGVNDLAASFEFYKIFGFRNVLEGKSPCPWMFITDESVLISLRQEERSYLCLTYYALDMDERVKAIRTEGIRFRDYGHDSGAGREWWFTTLDGFEVQLIQGVVESTYQPEGKDVFSFPEEDFIFPDRYPNPVCGIYGELFHRVKDLKTSIQYWEKLGFETKQYHRGPHPYAVMTDGMNIMGLHHNTDLYLPGLTYFAPDMGNRIEKIKTGGFNRMRDVSGTGGGADNVAARTPDGHVIYLFSF